MMDLTAEDDPLFEDAVYVVMEAGEVSVPVMQRRLRVGAPRAEKLIALMELRGIVGPHTNGKTREILVTSTDPRNLPKVEDRGRNEKMFDDAEEVAKERWWREPQKAASDAEKASCIALTLKRVKSWCAALFRCRG